MKIEEIEKILDKKYKPLRFKGVTPKTYAAAIQLAIDGQATYLNSDKTPQCPKDRMRGVRDIYRICKYYFPEIKLKTVLEKLQPQVHSFCNETKQSVYQGYKYHNYENVKINIGKQRPVEIEN